MRSLPFTILLRSEPAVAPDNRDYAGLLNLDYIGKSLAFSTVPSADSFTSLRRRAGSSQAPQPFLGFGDPLLGPRLPLPNAIALPTNSFTPRIGCYTISLGSIALPKGLKS